jgi:hypothetical protein
VPKVSAMGLTNRDWYRKDSYEIIPPVPFVALDYVLCVVVVFLVGIASNAQIASLVVSAGR